MHTRNIKRVPVVRDGRLVGIVARSDLVRALALQLEEAAAAPTAGAPTTGAGALNEALRRRREESGR
jgi:hypothetical protein